MQARAMWGANRILRLLVAANMRQAPLMTHSRRDIQRYSLNAMSSSTTRSPTAGNSTLDRSAVEARHYFCSVAATGLLCPARREGDSRGSRHREVVQRG